MAPRIAARDDCIESALHHARVRGLGVAELAGFVDFVAASAKFGNG